jgi:hypothetical protein
MSSLNLATGAEEGSRHSSPHPSAAIIGTDPRSRKLPGGLAPLLENICHSASDPIVVIGSSANPLPVNRDRLTLFRMLRGTRRACRLFRMSASDTAGQLWIYTPSPGGGAPAQVMPIASTTPAYGLQAARDWSDRCNS